MAWASSGMSRAQYLANSNKHNDRRGGTQQALRVSIKGQRQALGVHGVLGAHALPSATCAEKQDNRHNAPSRFLA